MGLFFRYKRAKSLTETGRKQDADTEPSRSVRNIDGRKTGVIEVGEL